MKKNIAIVFFGDCFYDARCINMMLSLSEKHSVSVVCVFDKKPSNLVFDNCQFFQIKIEREGVGKYLEFYKQALKFLKRHQYEYIIAGDLYSLASACAYTNSSKIIYDCREIYSSLFAHINKPFYRLLCGLYEKYFLRFVDTVLVTALTDLNFLKKKYHQHKHLNWEIIYNYPIKPHVSNLINLREKYNIPNNHIVILYQGVVHRGRGISQLIKLTSLNCKISSVIIGGGFEKNNYVNYANSLSVSNRVYFISKVPYLDLFKYSTSCDLGWCLINGKNLSYKYALPNKLFEYLLGGLPVLSTSLPNLKKIISDYNIGLLADYDNVNQQNECVKLIMKNKKRPSFYKNIVEKHFTWDVQKETFLKLFYR